jgi:calcineurin-like phosphoesterase family protein
MQKHPLIMFIHTPFKDIPPAPVTMNIQVHRAFWYESLVGCPFSAVPEYPPMNLTLQHQQDMKITVSTMDSTYLVEIRLSRTKWRIKKITNEIAHNFGIGDFLELHPHVTLFGPLTIRERVSSRQMLEAIGNVAARYDPLPFLIDGWEKRDGMHGSVIAFPVRASEHLRQITREIAQVLTPLTTSQNVWDGEPDQKWFHVTIANRLGSDQASAIFSRLTGQDQKPKAKGEIPERKPGLLQRFLPAHVREKPVSAILPVLLDETGIRITVMRDMAILAEYDLIEKRWIYGDHRHSAPRWQKTLVQYRHHAGLEHRDPEPSLPDDVFLIADLHLGHANIIRYCSRPFFFSDSREMDHVLIKNWNYTISPKTRIYCLGDLRYGPEAEPATQYRKRLRGDIVLIRGNHDDRDTGTIASAETAYEDLKFFLVHDPADAPQSYDGWVIHGHHHNNDLRHYPYMNFIDRRVNVSAEVIGYKPVSLHEIVQRIRERGASGDTSPILFRYAGEQV